MHSDARALLIFVLSLVFAIGCTAAAIIINTSTI
jgi:hypothetical protein